MASIGVDIGALFLKAVRLDEAGRIVASVYERHRGEPADVLSEALDRLNVQPDGFEIERTDVDTDRRHRET